MLGQNKLSSLQDLIKEYRQSSSNQSTFMTKAINDIKKELNLQSKETKTNALIKLLFLYLNYYDIKWASFNTLEIMSTCGIKGKLYAYLLAPLQYKNNPDFLQLIPNQIRSDLHKANLNNINSALNCLNNIINIQLSNELLKDFESQLNLNNNLIRKKIIIALTLSCEQFAKKMNSYSYWEDYIIKLISILGMKDTSNGVSICIISSIQRICKLSPQNCMMIFVELMNYFTKCEVNWNLIKIIDIFNMLFAFEPKFSKKKEFIKILSEQLVKTKSKSVEAELVKLIITHFNAKTNPFAKELIYSTEEKLKQLLFSQDNNLLLLSLKILDKISDKEKYLNDIFKIIDNNVNNKQILIESIGILKKICNKENYNLIVEKINKLIDYVGKYAIEGILDICTKENYKLISDSKETFLWFVYMIFEISYKLFIKEEQNEHYNNDLERICITIRDISQRIEMLRENLIDISWNYIQKLMNYQKEIIKENIKNKNIKENLTSKIEFAYLNDRNETQISEQKNIENNECNVNGCYLIEILLFIIGEYSTKDIDAKLQTLINITNENRQYIEKRFYVYFIISIIKLYLKSNNPSDNSESINSLIKATNLSTQPQEVKDWINYLNSLISNSQNGNLSQIKDNYFKIQMNPLAQNAQDLVLPSKSLDLNACLPINDEEIDIFQWTKKSKGEKKQSSSSELKIDTNNYTPYS